MVSPHHFAALIVAPFIGSFLSVLVVRLPVGAVVTLSRSRCPACAHLLGPFDLLPLASWLASGGRCRYCGGGIAPLYPLLEVAALIVAGWAALVLDGLPFWFSCLLGWALLALAASDLRALLLPDALTLPLVLGGLAVAAWLEPSRLPAHVAGAVAGYGSLYAVNAAYRRLRGRDGLGLGDAKLLAAGGAWLGWQALPSVLLIAAVTALAGVAAARCLGRRFKDDTALPFGAFLALAIWCVWLHGALII